MTPLDEQRAAQEYKRFAQANRHFLRSLHLSAASAVIACAAIFVLVRGDTIMAILLYVGAVALNRASHRASDRGRRFYDSP